MTSGCGAVVPFQLVHFNTKLADFIFRIFHLRRAVKQLPLQRIELGPNLIIFAEQLVQQIGVWLVHRVQKLRVAFVYSLNEMFCSACLSREVLLRKWREIGEVRKEVQFRK